MEVVLSQDVFVERTWILAKRNMKIDPIEKSMKNIIYRDILETRDRHMLRDNSICYG
jgi:hypothetical protein